MEARFTVEVTENPSEYFISSASYGLVYKDKPLCVKDTELRAGGGGINLSALALLSDQNTEHISCGSDKQSLCAIRITLSMKSCRY